MSRVICEDGTIAVSAFDLPLSVLLDSGVRTHLLDWMKWEEQLARRVPEHWANPAAVQQVRELFDELFYPPLIAGWKARYPVRIREERLGGVRCELFTPEDGVPPDHDDRVLINLHGGAFFVGARYSGQLESIPLAALGQCTVLSVDYRRAPEHRYPAATDDVVAVYRQLLEKYSPRQIGIVGCSTGALLGAQTIARLLHDGLPLPAGLALLCAGGSYWSEGDSARLGVVLADEPLTRPGEHSYFAGVDVHDPLAFPAHSPGVLREFPPTALISATRDWGLSSVVHTHSRLVSLGVEAHLHIWEGLGHAFFCDPDLPQSHEAYERTVRFIDRCFKP